LGFGSGGLFLTAKLLIIKRKYLKPKTIIADKTKRKAVEENPVKKEEIMFIVISFLKF
jgi:hypothetical protein